MTNLATLNSQLMAFINESPTPYHAVNAAKSRLVDSGFKELSEANAWSLRSGEKYFICRKDASLIAFKVGKNSLPENGIRMMGTHSDSPCLKVKPNPIKKAHGYLQLAVETYGGVLLNPWFDRDLSLAGKVIVKDKQGQIKQHLLDFKEPIAVIPSLAIHLDRSANEKRTINPQEDIKPILLQASEVESLAEMLETQLKNDNNWREGDEILESDLRFYDTQKAAFVGLDRDFICCARLDNLLSSYLSLQSLLDDESENSCLFVMNDHEEAGSQSEVGAQSNMLNSVLDRLTNSVEDRHRLLAQSLMLSIDNAHGIHPNFANRHDDNHGPLINGGPVLKFDANQSYATSSHSAAMVRMFAEEAKVPLQSYVTRTGTRCGSTIGPMTAAKTGVETVDLGLATFAMHSIRETGGARDPGYLYQLLRKFLATEKLA